MSRKTSPVTELVNAPVDHKAVAAAGKAATELVVIEAQHAAHVRAVAERVGYQLPGEAIDADLIQRDISANMRRSVEACLEVGKGLLVLKEACGHGNFLARLDVLGIEPRVGQKFMASAAKFANTALTPHLAKAIGNQTKLFEMLVLDDEQLEELVLTGQTGELALDDVATMSVKELRAALRGARETDQAKQRLINDKNAEIDKLKSKKAFKPKAGAIERNELEASQLQELATALDEAEVTFLRLANVAEVVAESDSPAMRERAQQTLAYMAARMRETVLATRLDVRVDDATLLGRPEA